MNTGNMEETLHAYLDAGMALVFFPNNVKGPIGSAAMGWNRPENCITRDKADKLRDLASRPTNVGLAHAYSGTCSIDIDNLFAAREWLAQHNVDLDALFNADDSVTIDSGRGNHGKLLYRLPKVMPQKKISSTSGGDIIDFRCAAANGNTVQDCLPPSYNPDAKAHYQWGGNGDYRSLPVIPPELLAVWQSLVDAQAHANAEPFVGNIDSLDHLSLSHKTLTTIQTGVHPDAKAEGKENDRSWNLIKALNAMVSAGASEQLIAETVSNPQYPISNKPLEKGASWLKAEIQRAQLYIGAQKQQIGELNVVDKRTGEITTVDFIVADTSANDGDAIGIPNTMRHIDIGDLATAEYKAPESIVQDIIPRDRATLFGGHGGSGKSYLALVLAAHVATGKAWAELESVQERVLFVSMEDDADILRYRLKKIVQQYGLPMQTVTEGIDLIDATEVEALAVEHHIQGHKSLRFTIEYEWLQRNVTDHGLLIVDNASDAFAADENNRTQVRMFMRSLNRIAKNNHMGAVLLAHVDKAAARGGSRSNSYSGSTAWHNSARSRIALVDGALVHEKNNMGALLPEPIRIAFSDNGVPVPDDGKTEAMCNALSASSDDKEVLALIEAALDVYGYVPTATTGPRTTAKHLQEMPEASRRLTGDGGNKRINEAIVRLARAKKITRGSYTNSDRKRKETWLLKVQK